MSDNRNHSEARIAVSPETRDEVKGMKRGGETYDELLRKMLAQYDPSEKYEA